MALTDHETNQPAEVADVANQAADGQRTWLGRLASLILSAGSLALAGALIACLLAPFSYYGDLLSNFRAQYVWVGGVLVLVSLPGRQWRWALLAVLLTLPHVGQVLPYYWPPTWVTSQLESRAAPVSSEVASKHERLRLVSFNVLYLNQDRDATLQFLRAADADLIVLCECTDGWFEAVQRGLADTHPYNSTALFPMWDGTRIFSRQPLHAATDLPYFREIPEAEKLLAVTTTWQNQTIMVMGVHPASPVNAQRFQWRNDMLGLMARVGVQVREPLIIAGDFNCTSGSPHFLRESALLDSRSGFGWQGSWPTFAPAFLRIPIDHVFVNRHWEVRHREIGPTLGSDHSPVITELQLGPAS